MIRLYAQVPISTRGALGNQGGLDHPVLVDMWVVHPAGEVIPPGGSPTYQRLCVVQVLGRADPSPTGHFRSPIKISRRRLETGRH